MLDAQRSTTTVSWIWGSLLQTIKILRQGVCYQLCVSSSLRIKEDPWLPTRIDFRIPLDLVLPSHIFLVKDLMTTDGRTWDIRQISNLFPNSIKDTILNTKIHDMKQDNLVWMMHSYWYAKR